MASDDQPNVDPNVWGGLAPFIKMAFSLNGSQNQTQGQAQSPMRQLQMPTRPANAQSPLNTTGIPANTMMGHGPMVAPKQPYTNAMSPVLQQGVAGPMSVNPTMAPSTAGLSIFGAKNGTAMPLSNTQPADHSFTGNPNPSGFR